MHTSQKGFIATEMLWLRETTRYDQEGVRSEDSPRKRFRRGLANTLTILLIPGIPKSPGAP